MKNNLSLDHNDQVNVVMFPIQYKYIFSTSIYMYNIVMQFIYTSTCRILHANMMQFKPPITFSYLLMKSQHSISRRPHQNMYIHTKLLIILSDSCLQGHVSTPALMHPNSGRHVKECMLDLAISYAILKSFTEIGRNFVAALCNSISLRCSQICFPNTPTQWADGSGICRFSALGKTQSFESGYFANTKSRSLYCERVSMQA